MDFSSSSSPSHDGAHKSKGVSKPSTFTPAEQAALAALRRDGWEVQYSPMMRRWTLKKGCWVTLPHQTVTEACEAAEQLQEATQRTIAEQARQRDALRAYLKRGA